MWTKRAEVARSNPARSPYCATRHLLRNLRRPRELRRNPLTRDAWHGRSIDEALRAIAERVEKAIAAMGVRQVAILLRVDVERHDPRLVAADLGLSTRQFHRERRVAHDRFYIAYRANERAAAATVTGDFTEQLLARATSLADSGETASAIAILEDVLSSGADVAVRCEALTHLAEVEAWAHRFERARAHLHASETILRNNGAANLDRLSPALYDACSAVELLLRWFEHGPASVARNEGNGSLASHTAAGRVAFVRAAAALRNGEAAHASHVLHQLNGDAHQLHAPELEIDLLALQAELAEFTAENPSLSEELFARAAAIAERHGLQGRRLYALHQLALTRWAHTRLPEDRRAYRAMVDRIDRSLPPRLRSYLIFSAADVELAIGHPQRALSAAQAAEAVSTNRYESFSANSLAAGALLRLGNIRDAGMRATLAAEAARSEGHPRVVALAQRITAQAHLAQGNRRAARAAIEEAIECARRFSSPHALAQTQTIWSRITGR